MVPMTPVTAPQNILQTLTAIEIADDFLPPDAVMATVNIFFRSRLWIRDKGSYSTIMKNARKLYLSNQKRRKSVAVKRGQDRISGLPDSVLCHILSFLTTKDAVASSILSSRWRHVWTSLHTLMFDASLSVREGEFTDATMERFESFVNAVLLRTHPATLQKFCLHSYRLTASARLNAWLSSAIMRDVRELELNVEYEQRLELPQSIYSCRTLEVLKLESEFDINIPASGMCFPNVKFLYVTLKFPENQLTEKLFASCPSLEDLWINAYLKCNGPATNFIISSSTLKRFYWTVLDEDYQLFFNNCDHKCVIEAPVLQVLHIVDALLLSYEVHDLHFLQTVNLEIFFPDWSQLNPKGAVQLLQAVLNCKSVTLSSGIIQALVGENVSVLPSVPQLTHLEVSVGETGWRVIHGILTACPQLETFLLEKKCWFDITDPQFGWMESGCVPHCLAEHLKDIEIKGVEAEDDDVKLVEYFINQCSVLQNMTIRRKPSLSKKHARILEHKLSQLHRGSAICEIWLV